MRKLDFLIVDPMWRRVSIFLSIMFFIFLADAILSDWVPGYMQDVTGSATKMGFIMAFSSVVGLLADFVFPQMLRGTTVKKLMVYAMGGSLVFAGILLWTTWWPLILLFLAAMAVWGIYYEFFGFMTQQFVVEVSPLRLRSGVWAILETFKCVAYAIGPLIGGWLLTGAGGNRSVVAISMTALLLAFIGFRFARMHDRPVQVEAHEINLRAEVAHWSSLAKHVWPVLVISLFIGLVDSVYWTTGTVLTDQLSKTNWAGGWFLTLYMLPPLFVGFLVAKLGIYQRKKYWAELLFLASGICLAAITLVPSVWWYLAMVFVSSTLSALTIPLVDAVYTDLIARMGRERKHLVGLCSSMNSVAYIVGPIIAGVISTQVGELPTFAILGGSVIIVSVALLIFTPRKLKLPQLEITTWE